MELEHRSSGYMAGSELSNSPRELGIRIQDATRRRPGRAAPACPTPRPVPT
jgi:hypothetical protein